MDSTRKLLIAVLAMCLAFGLSGCAGQQQPSGAQGESAAAESQDEPVAGGWTVNAEAEAMVDDAYQKAFDEAMAELDGVDYEPIAVLGRQVVAGSNYAFLCKATPVVANPQTGWSIVTVYQDLQGKAELLCIKDIDLADVKTVAKSSEPMTGGWEGIEITTGAKLPEGADTAFSAAVENLGDDAPALLPVALLGTQVVAGTNYLMICGGADADTAMTPPTSDPYVAIVYQDPSNECQITDLDMLDLAYYTTEDPA